MTRSPRLAGTLAPLLCMLLLPPALVAGDDAVLVENPATALQPPLEITLEPEWTVGLDDEVLFGEILRVVADEQDALYVLDGQLHEIQVFSAEGEWLRSLGREGEAPGEFRAPTDLLLRPGGRLAVIQRRPPRIAQLGLQGEPLDDIRLPGNGEGLWMLSRGLPWGEDLVVVGSALEFEADAILREILLARIDTQGKELARYHSDRGRIDMAILKVSEVDVDDFGNYWTVLDDERIAVAPDFDAYRVLLFAPDGTLEHEIRRQVSARVRDDSEKDLARARFMMRINGRPVDLQLSPVERIVDGLHPGPEGTLLVEVDDPSVPRDRSVLARFDQFDAQGHYLRQWVLRGPGNPIDDRVLFCHGRIVLARNVRDDEREDIETPELGPPHLVVGQRIW